MLFLNRTIFCLTICLRQMSTENYCKHRSPHLVKHMTLEADQLQTNVQPLMTVQQQAVPLHLQQH